MRTFFHCFVILVTLIAFGVAKLRVEDGLSHDMVEQRLIQPPIEKGTSLQIGQTSAAVAFGGLRSLIAAVWNMRAFLHFENLDWIKVEQSYKVITTLQPQNIHYWQTGAWHMSTNALAYYREKPGLSPLRRTSMQNLYIKKGSDFLEEGVRENPDSWKLHSQLARLWSDHTKLPDLNRAVGHYDDTLACKSLPDYRRNMFKRFRFYAMTRIPDRYPEALKLGKQLYYESEQNQTPSLCNYLFALQNALDLPESERIPDTQLFPNPKIQLHWLQNLWNRRNQDYPEAGVRQKIDELQRSLTPT